MFLFCFLKSVESEGADCSLLLIIIIIVRRGEYSKEFLLTLASFPFAPTFFVERIRGFTMRGREKEKMKENIML